LSFDNLRTLRLQTTEEFRDKYKVDLTIPTALITVHPETIGYAANEEYIIEFVTALKSIKGVQYLITMPNADTMGNIIRDHLQQFATANPGVAFCFENLGTIGYLSAMKYCSFMLGNTSSGFIEAGFFPKWVINVGERQNGRVQTANIINVPFDAQRIAEAVESLATRALPAGVDLFGDGHAAEKIIAILKNTHA
jgi:GDP/UDP-N,N'-diacetylbacillosamine 2-epimerase (hydrolysing)